MKIVDNILLAECTTRDYKRELERSKKGKWLKSVSAFANTTGGVLLFGIDDDASVVGLTDTQADSEFISEAINAHLDPIPIFTLTPKQDENGKNINHLIHRDYADFGAEVAINIYADRIETTSPGGIKDASELEPVDPKDTASHRRNPVIAEVFAQLRYMEKRGSGLRKIIDSTVLLPTFKEDRKPFFVPTDYFFILSYRM